MTAVETAAWPMRVGWVCAPRADRSADLALADFLRLGADIEILEPAELRKQAARTIQAMAAIYD